MNSALSLVLIVSIVTSAVPVTAQERFNEPGFPGAQSFDGPITRALPREIARLLAPENVSLAVAGQQPHDPIGSDWARVASLAAGTLVTVTVDGHPPRRVRIKRVTDVGMRVSDPAGLDEMIDRRDVTDIRVGVRRGSVPGAIGGSVLGALLGVSIAVGLGLNVRCQPSCGGVEAGMWLSAVGLPIAAGIGGFHLFAQRFDVVIYHAQRRSASAKRRGAAAAIEPRTDVR